MVRPPLLVLALGNPLRGDDGIGLAVLEQLKHRDLPPDVELLDGGTCGLEIVLEFGGRSAVVVVDAAGFGGEPGELRRFDLLALAPRSAEWGVGHAHGLAASIELAGALGLLPPQLVLYAVQPGSVESLLALSDTVAASIPRVTASVI